MKNRELPKKHPTGGYYDRHEKELENGKGTEQ